MTNTEHETRATGHEQRTKVAAFGDTDFVMPFSALGLDTWPVELKAEDIIETAKKIIENKYALIVVAENIAAKAEEVFSDYSDVPTPCVVVVPFPTESEGFATQALADVLRMAIGINILQDN